MPNSSVLITGGTGLLALNWACAIRASWDVILGTNQHSVALQGVKSERLNLNSVAQFGKQLDTLQPDLVVHTAGLANVDQCEQHPDLAYHANALIARHVAEATAIRNIPLIHISTDHLFVGDHCFYKETDQPEPLNEYGRTKRLAEEWVLEAHASPLIIRTNFFGWGHLQRQSLSDWLINTMREGKQLTLFDDVYFTPILADHLALTAHELLNKGVSGVFNVVGDERLSKYQFGLAVCQAFGLPDTLIQRGQIAKSALTTARPRDMSLANGKIRQVLARELGHVKDYLLALYAQETAGRRNELLKAIH